MILAWLLVITAGAGIVAWLVGRWNATACRWVALAALGLDFALLLFVWVSSGTGAGVSPDSPWLLDFDYPWIAPFGIRFHLAIDGLSLLLLLLTAFLGAAAVGAWGGSAFLQPKPGAMPPATRTAKIRTIV